VSSTVAVRVPGALRPWAGGQPVVHVETADAPTVRAVLDRLAAGYPDLERRVRDEQGRVRVHVNVFVGPENVRDLDGLDTEVPAGAELTILPAVSGGR
jgi:molybdopterin synthase sulfur carrier subunit